MLAVEKQQLRKPPPDFKRLFIEDENELSLVTGTVLAQRINNNQQKVPKVAEPLRKE